MPSSPHNSENAIASSSEEEYNSPMLKPSTDDLARVSLNENSFKLASEEFTFKNTGLQLHSINSFRMTDFNKRPLSDTPIVSTDPSPNDSQVASPDLSPEMVPNINNILEIPTIKLSKRRGTAFDLPGITKNIHSPTTEFIDNEASSKLVIVMVGLPARGKSYITNKLTRYLNWLQHECRVFNVGNTRRKDAATHHLGPSKGPLPDSTTEHDASFFDPKNSANTQIREKWAMDTLEQLMDFLLKGSGSVGIFDATNSTKNRRKKILDRIRARSKDLKILYLESICTDNSIVQKNVRLKLSGPDYKNMDPELALKDFQGRLYNYEKAYETIEDDENVQYIKMIDVGKKVVAFNIQGFLASQAIYYLLNFNLNERQIWIARHGESDDNVTGRIGGDSLLTPRGDKFSKALAKFMKYQKEQFRDEQVNKHTKLLSEGKVDKIPVEPTFNIWTSMLQRSVQTSKYFTDDQFDVKEIRMLNELCAGDCEGMTYEEIQNKYPEEFMSRINDKLHYRYPGIGGESYLDVINRVRPIINEVERTVDHVLLVTHRIVARVLLGYFLNLDRDMITSLDVPLHCVYLLEPKPYGVEWSLYEYDEAKDWFYKVEKENLHKKKVREVGVAFRERKFSVVPTAPPRFKSSNSNSTTNSGIFLERKLPGSSPLDSLNKARGVHRNDHKVEVEKLAEKLNKIKG